MRIVYGLLSSIGQGPVPGAHKGKRGRPEDALAILSGMEAEEFARTVGEMTFSLGEYACMEKTAERLLIEMRDQLSDWEDSGAVNLTGALLHPPRCWARSGNRAAVAGLQTPAGERPLPPCSNLSQILLTVKR